MQTPRPIKSAEADGRPSGSEEVHRTTYRLPEFLETELGELAEKVERFRTGAITEAEFRAFRVPQGIYEQRESGTYMLRVRFPAGGVLPQQLKRLAAVSTDYGNGVLHLTTRQDLQVHRVALESIYPALRSLLESGLSTKGGGGNTVRNITTCSDSGVCPDGEFDAAPYAVAVTERLLPDRLSFELPRKYKIAFSACRRDCAGATVHDLGFIARRQNGVEGFAVYAGGGLGAKSRVADRLEAFVPAGDAFLVAEAVKRVFDKNGDRKHKHQARLRFLVERIGFEAFRRLYEAELAALRAAGPEPLVVRPMPRRVITPSNAERGMRSAESRLWNSNAERGMRSAESRLRNSNAERGMRSAESPPAVPMGSPHAYDPWARTNVKPQKQPGYFRVEIPLALGDLAAGKMTALADLVESHGEGLAYATQVQNLVLRWVSEAELPAVHAKLASLGLAEPQPAVLSHLVSCAGASTCRLGICHSRGLSRAVAAALRDSGVDLEKAGDLHIQTSGCPNSCGRHPVADIGLSGAARRVGDRLVPHYTLQLGGRVAEGKTRLAVTCGVAPARRVPALVTELVKQFLESGCAPDFQAFVDGDGRRIAEALVAHHRSVPSYAEDKSFYFDWDADAPFSLAGRGAGECSAGVFDLIEMDLAGAREALNQGRGYAASALAARSLLVTRGIQPKNDAEAFARFQKHFVDEGLVDARFGALVAAGQLSADDDDPERAFAGAPRDVSRLVAAVKSLYESMDASLRFKPVSPSKP